MNNRNKPILTLLQINLAFALFAFLALPVLAQNETAPQASIPGQTNSALNAAARADQSDSTAKTPAAAPKLSPGIDEVLKLVQAGVSLEVIKSYIESSPIAYRPTAADLITLKRNGVADDLTTAILKHGAELRTQARQKSADAAAALAARNSRSGYLDPEGYDFWWYHYAYPRALAHANQTLFWSYPR